MMENVLDEIDRKFSQIPKADSDIYKIDNKYTYEFRAKFDGRYRKGTRSQIVLGENNFNVLDATIRYPPISDAESVENKVLCMSHRNFDKRAGIYRRGEYIHTVYPARGSLYNCGYNTFISNYQNLVSDFCEMIL